MCIYKTDDDPGLKGYDKFGINFTESGASENKAYIHLVDFKEKAEKYEGIS